MLVKSHENKHLKLSFFLIYKYVWILRRNWKGPTLSEQAQFKQKTDFDHLFFSEKQGVIFRYVGKV